MRYEYKTEDTCSQLIRFDINDNVVTGIEFYGTGLPERFVQRIMK